VLVLFFRRIKETPAHVRCGKYSRFAQTLENLGIAVTRVTGESVCSVRIVFANSQPIISGMAKSNPGALVRVSRWTHCAVRLIFSAADLARILPKEDRGDKVEYGSNAEDQRLLPLTSLRFR
jgi:hypothetical protein